MLFEFSFSIFKFFHFFLSTASFMRYVSVCEIRKLIVYWHTKFEYISQDEKTRRTHSLYLKLF